MACIELKNLFIYMMVTQTSARTCTCTESLISNRILNKKGFGKNMYDQHDETHESKIIGCTIYLFTIVGKFRIVQVYLPARIKQSINVT